MRKYKIWDKVSHVKTPSGEVFTAEEWIDRYPILSDKNIHGVLSNSVFDGAIFAVLEQMKNMCESEGAVFDEELAGDDLLLAIEQFETDAAEAGRIKAEEEEAARIAAEEADRKIILDSLQAEQAIAGALAYQNMMNY